MYENYVVPLLERARKLMPRTRGIMLDKMNKSLVSSASYQVCLKGWCSSQEGCTNFDPLERILGGEAQRCLLHKICGKAKCMYGYPLLTFNFALSNFNGFTFCSHYCV
jgi:hypothetical protein